MKLLKRRRVGVLALFAAAGVIAYYLISPVPLSQARRIRTGMTVEELCRVFPQEVLAYQGESTSESRYVDLAGQCQQLYGFSGTLLFRDMRWIPVEDYTVGIDLKRGIVIAVDVTFGDL